MATELQYTLFFYKNYFRRKKALIFGKKNLEQTKNKARLAIPKNIRKRYLA